MATQEHCAAFLSAFLRIELRYRKYDSEDNRGLIVERMASFAIEPSITLCKRAIAELIEEGQISRTDGLTNADDVRIAAEKAEAKRQRELAELRAAGIPTTAAEYHALNVRSVGLRYKSEPLFKKAIDRLIAAGEI